MDNGYLTARSYVDKNEFYRDVDAGRITYAVFVKPVKGSASININKVSSKEELELLVRRYDDLMIQEFMDGDEIGADVYIDLISGEPVAIFAKEKIKRCELVKRIRRFRSRMNVCLSFFPILSLDWV